MAPDEVLHLTCFRLVFAYNRLLYTDITVQNIRQCLSGVKGPPPRAPRVTAAKSGSSFQLQVESSPVRARCFENTFIG